MPRALLLVPALLMLATPGHVRAQVHRCAMSDGTTVFTDRRCDTLGAFERSPPAASAAQLRTYRPGCPRTLRDLAFEVSSSVQSHDVNRLAGVYLWNGLGTREGYALMDRLQLVVDRPLVDLQPIWPGSDDESYPGATPTRPPVGLRLDQTSKGGSTPLRTTFGLRKHLDCWWIVEGGVRRSAAASAAPPASTPEPTPAPADPADPVD